MSNWINLIETTAESRPAPIHALIHEGGIGSRSRPQKYVGDDGALYAVKFAQNAYGDGRAIFTEQIVARAGSLIGAPVPFVELVYVADELVPTREDEDVVLDFVPLAGIHHGSRWVGINVSDRVGLQERFAEVNRFRLGALDILFAWIPYNGDHQFIYRNEEPHEIWSVDHSTCFPNGPMWSAEVLREERNVIVPDPELAASGLSKADRAESLDRLRRVSDEDLARIVAIPPEWGVSLVERAEVASYLAVRRDAVVDAFV